MRFAKAYGFLMFCACMGATDVFAQTAPTQMEQIQQRVMDMEHVHPSAKAVIRDEIDTKRWGLNEGGEDVMPRSREFKRIDSTYYVGWMLEGFYKYNHAEDYLGFKNASVPLLRATDLMERDYKKALSTRSGDVLKFVAASRILDDYSKTTYMLANCYSNMNDPEKVFALLRRVQKWNFQRDFFDVYDWMAWTVHRNRFYTNEKYSFLKNSIDANEKLANTYLDSQLRKISKNVPLNATIWRDYDGSTDRLGVYHYKNILYSYVFNIDSAEHYFNLMRSSPIFPHNNYATFRSICGDFKTAESEYKLAMDQDQGDKRLKEWAYYRSILDIYKGYPKSGGELMREMIKVNGTTPGYGWYNIALARCMVYDGQRIEAERYTGKAAEFKELHIGTTLGQSHYDFSVQLLKLMNKLHAQEAKRFENSDWWYNPYVLAKMAELTADKYTQQFLIINQFAQNPERDRVIYKLFSTESTVTWDEIWYLISDFSTQYFLDKYTKEVETDPRKNITRYFKYFVARLEMKQDNYDLAHKELDEILKDPGLDADYEKLLIARVCQAQAECARKRKDDNAYNTWMYKAYVTYPQLIPYTGLKMDINLHIKGMDEKLVKRLKNCNVNWTEGNPLAPDAYISFAGSGNKKRVFFSVRDKQGNIIIEEQALPYSDSEPDVGVVLAYRLFKIGGDIPKSESGIDS